MNITYKPEPCIDGKKKKAEFTGEVVLRAPAYEERLEMLSSDPDLVNAISGNAGEADVSSNLKSLLALAKWSYGFYVKVDIKRNECGTVFDNLDKLRFDARAQGILQDVALKLSQGFTLGK